MRFFSIFFTFIVFAAHRAAYAGSVNSGGNCSTADNKLQVGSFQFWSDCNSVTFCTDQGICTPKGCRKDEFPFGYTQGANLPPKCPSGQFCPDEGSACQDVLAVGSPCQLNRDGINVVYPLITWLTSKLDQCEPPPNFEALRDTSGRGLNFNGSVCLNNVCMYDSILHLYCWLDFHLWYLGGLMLRWVQAAPLKMYLILPMVSPANLSISCPGMFLFVLVALQLRDFVVAIVNLDCTVIPWQKYAWPV